MTENNERTETKHVAPRRSVHLVNGQRTSGSRCREEAAVMHAGFLSADMDGIFLGALADFFGGFFHAVGQDIAEAFSLNNLSRSASRSLDDSPFQVDAAGILLRQNTFFI